MLREMTAITQIHLYIKEHYRPGDVITTCEVCSKLKHLSISAISAALWRLGVEGILFCSVRTGPLGCNEYMVEEGYMVDRGYEDRKAPEPGAPRNRKIKQEHTHA